MQNTIPRQIEMQMVQLDSTKLAVHTAGEGIPVVCLHAVGHSAEDYRSILSAPPPGVRLIAVDFPGQGQSPPSPDGRVSSAAYAEYVTQLIRKLRLDRPILVGNSIGGATALRLAARSDIAARGLVLANPGGLDNRKFPGDFVLRVMVAFFQAGVRGRFWYPFAFRLYYRMVLSNRRARARRDSIVRDSRKLAPLLVSAWRSFRSADEDLRGLIQSVDCPVLIVWAMSDRFIQYGRNIAALREFRQARIARYKIGHTPSLEDPERFARDLQEFCSACRE